MYNIFWTFLIYFIYILALKIILKKMGLIWTILIFHKTFGKKYVAMATMIICVKHFVNIPDKKKLILTLKIIIKKMGNWFEKFSFFTKIMGEICCHGNQACSSLYTNTQLRAHRRAEKKIKSKKIKINKE